MQRITTRGWRKAAALSLMLVLATVWLAAAAPLASAAPVEPTLDLDQLQALLDANGGSVSGYFKTVLKGATIEQIPATVLAISAHETQDGALILFAASGPVMDQIGGIADGMSGSPLYVDDNGTAKLVGAVSWGEMFTLGGLGLATPIQYMSAIESTYDVGGAPPARAVRLAKPVRTPAGRVDRIVLARSRAAAWRLQCSAGAPVFAPLGLVQINGLAPGSRAYKTLAKHLRREGLDVAASSLGGGYDPGFETPLVGGASLAALYAVGDLWVGAAGTVTYAHDNVVLAFGHPLDWMGETSLYLANAWVDGIWASSIEPGKIIAPCMLRGTITEDRNSGIAGTIAELPVTVPVTSQATLMPEDRTVTGSTNVTQWVADSYDYSILPAVAATVPIEKVTDAAAFAGSAATTSVVVVSDGSQSYTITRDNLWDSGGDVGYLAASDLAMITARLTVNAQGVAPAQIQSASLTTTVTAQRKSAHIVGVQVPGGLRPGKNTVQTILAAYGTRTLQVATTTLVLPAGTPTDGVLQVKAPRSQDGGDYYFRSARGTRLTDNRPTVAQIVAKIAKLPQNNDLIVTYRPGPSRPSGPERNVGSSKGAVTATSHTDWVTQGSVTRPTGEMFLALMPKTVSVNDRVMLNGLILSAHGQSSVKIYQRATGASSFQLVATVPVVVEPRPREFPVPHRQDNAQHDLQGGLGRRRQVPRRHGHTHRPRARPPHTGGQARACAAGRPREAHRHPRAPAAGRQGLVRAPRRRHVGADQGGPGDRRRHSFDDVDATVRHQHRAGTLCGQRLERAHDVRQGDREAELTVDRCARRVYSL